MPSKSLDDLTPDTRAAADALLAFAAASGIDVLVTHTLRTCDEQNAIYAQGRTTPGGVVTNAPGCRSWHTHGRAMDLAVMDGGKMVHNGLDERYARLGEYARTLGFKWGGDFGDYGHFEYHPGLGISQACPDPTDCSHMGQPSSSGPAQPVAGKEQVASMGSIVPGAAIGALCLGAVAYMFADIRWGLTDRILDWLDLG